MRFDYLVDTVHLNDLGAEVVANEIATHSELRINPQEIVTKDKVLVQIIFYAIFVLPFLRKLRIMKNDKKEIKDK